MKTYNCRPISILAILPKLLRFFTYYPEEHKLLTKAQSGFRRLHSSVTSLLIVTNRWLQNIHKGFVTGMVFIYLRRQGFDTVNNDIMQVKLKVFGV